MHWPLILAIEHPLATHWDEPGAIAANFLGVFVLVFLNGFFVATEFALIKVRTSQLDPLIEEGDSRATLARHILAHLDSYLSATQFGVTLASLALGWIGEPYFARLLHPLFFLVGVTSHGIILPLSVALGLVAITFLHIIFGELAPKYLSIRDPLGMALFLVRPVQDRFPFGLYIVADHQVVAAVFHADGRRRADLEVGIRRPTDDHAGILGIERFLTRCNLDAVHVECLLRPLVQPREHDC